ncbi:hypothetical protein M9458_033715, partial [Cirrhinus mrigala]
GHQYARPRPLGRQLSYSTLQEPAITWLWWLFLLKIDPARSIMAGTMYLT